MSDPLLKDFEDDDYRIPAWADRNAIGQAWYSSYGDRAKAIRHIMHVLVNTTGGTTKDAEFLLDRFLRHNPDARNYKFED